MLIKYVEVHRRDFDSLGFSGKFEEEMASGAWWLLLHFLKKHLSMTTMGRVHFGG
jgi:hypothetical protein